MKLHAITCNLSSSEVTFILWYRKIKPLLQKHFAHKQNTPKQSFPKRKASEKNPSGSYLLILLVND